MKSLSGAGWKIWLVEVFKVLLVSDSYNGQLALEGDEPLDGTPREPSIGTMGIRCVNFMHNSKITCTISDESFGTLCLIISAINC